MVSIVGLLVWFTLSLANATAIRHVYTQNLWSFLDVTFGVIYWIYLIMRIHSWRVCNEDTAQQALDVLAMGAPVLIPRLAFNLLSNNLLFVCLRAMMVDFTMLTALAAWCFGGFLYGRAQMGLVLGQMAYHGAWRHSCRIRLAAAGRDGGGNQCR